MKSFLLGKENPRLLYQPQPSQDVNVCSELLAIPCLDVQPCLLKESFPELIHLIGVVSARFLKVLPDQYSFSQYGSPTCPRPLGGELGSHREGLSCTHAKTLSTDLIDLESASSSDEQINRLYLRKLCHI